MCDDSNLGYGLLPLGSFSNLQNMINIKKWLIFLINHKKRTPGFLNTISPIGASPYNCRISP